MWSRLSRGGSDGDGEQCESATICQRASPGSDITSIAGTGGPSTNNNDDERPVSPVMWPRLSLGNMAWPSFSRSDRSGGDDARDDAMRARSTLSTLETVESSQQSDGHAGPRWEDGVSTCSICNSLLGKRRGKPRHHCRVCGHCVCGTCSPNTVMLQPYGALERVCSVCVRPLARAPEIFKRQNELTRQLQVLGDVNVGCQPQDFRSVEEALGASELAISHLSDRHARLATAIVSIGTRLHALGVASHTDLTFMDLGLEDAVAFCEASLVSVEASTSKKNLLSEIQEGGFKISRVFPTVHGTPPATYVENEGRDLIAAVSGGGVVSDIASETKLSGPTAYNFHTRQDNMAEDESAKASDVEAGLLDVGYIREAVVKSSAKPEAANVGADATHEALSIAMEKLEVANAELTSERKRAEAAAAESVTVRDALASARADIAAEGANLAAERSRADAATEDAAIARAALSTTLVESAMAAERRRQVRGWGANAAVPAGIAPSNELVPAGDVCFGCVFSQNYLVRLLDVVHDKESPVRVNSIPTTSRINPALWIIKPSGKNLFTIGCSDRPNLLLCIVAQKNLLA